MDQEQWYVTKMLEKVESPAFLERLQQTYEFWQSQGPLFEKTTSIFSNVLRDRTAVIDAAF